MSREWTFITHKSHLSLPRLIAGGHWWVGQVVLKRMEEEMVEEEEEEEEEVEEEEEKEEKEECWVCVVNCLPAVKYKWW